MFQGNVGEVGCFGKLPLSPEFIRVNAKGGTLQAFDQWIQEGLVFCRAKLGPQWRSLFLESEIWNFVFQVPRQKDWLIGILTPSQDKAGRGFPMTLFLRIEEPNVDRSLIPMLPLFLQEFLEKAHHLLREEWKNMSLPEFRERVGQLTPASLPKWEQIEQLYHEFLNSYSLPVFLQVCGVSSQNLSEPGVKEIVERMVVANRPSSNNQMGQLMGFPLIDEPALPFEIPFWVEYMASINGKKMGAPLLFWNKCPIKGRAMLLTQEAPVTPKSFSTLIQSDQRLETLWEIRSMGEGELSSDEEQQSTDQQLGLNDNNNTLHGLLQRQQV